MDYMQLIAVLMLTVSLSRVAEARSCSVPEPIHVEFAKSSAVFLGRVTDKRVVRNADGVPDHTVATLEVIKSWKGPLNATLEVFTCSGDDVICNPGFEFLIGQDFVVFTTSDPLWVHGCDRTELATTARKTLRWLESKPARRVPNTRVKPAALNNGVLLAAQSRRGLRAER